MAVHKLFYVDLFQKSNICMLKMRWSILALACVVTAVVAEDKKDGKEKDIGTVIGIDLGTTYSW